MNAKIALFQTVHFYISTQFKHTDKCKNSSILKKFRSAYSQSLLPFNP